MGAKARKQLELWDLAVVPPATDPRAYAAAVAETQRKARRRSFFRKKAIATKKIAPPPTLAEPRCEAASVTTGERCARAAADGSLCAKHAQRAGLRDTVLALLCAEDVELWDVARRARVSEAMVRELVAEAFDVKLRIRRAIALERALGR